MSAEKQATTTLSKRERQCLAGLAAGLRVQDIADRLGTTNGTVEKQISAARKKLGAATREHAVAIAIRDGLISSSALNEREPDHA